MKIELELNDVELYYLKQYAKVYEKERKVDLTSNPIVLVQNTSYRHSFGDNPYDKDGYDLTINCNLITEDNPIFSYEEVFNVIIQEAEKRIEAKYTNKEEQKEIKKKFLDELLDFKYDVKHYSDYYIACRFDSKYIEFKVEIDMYPYEIIYDTVAYFLTREEAEKYIEKQKHNLKNPRIYTVSAGYNNFSDYTTLSNLLLNIGKKLNNPKYKIDLDKY